MKLVHKISAVAAALLLSTSVQAAPVLDVLFAGFQQLSDNSAETLVKGANNTQQNILEVGDVLRGIFTIETVEQAPSTRNLGGASGNNELTGTFEIEVVGKANVGGLFPFAFVFAPTATFTATYGAGAMVAVFEDSTPDYTRVVTGSAVTVDDMVGLATNGTHVLTAGFVDGDNFWTAASVTDNIATIGAIPAPGNGGLFNLGLDFTFRAPGWDFLDVPCFNTNTASIVQVGTCGSGSLLGTGGVSTPFQSFDNIDFTVNRVPEPMSILLLGAVAFGAGVVGRRAEKSRK